MPVTVRIQGLPPLADAIHVRDFFFGLKIPYGGVVIIGGILGEALVTFSNYENVKVALNRSGGKIMNSYIYVSVESVTELREACKKEKKKKLEVDLSVMKPSYLRISVKPFNSSFNDVRWFFEHLSVESVIFVTKNKKGRVVRNGQAIVKFGKLNHAHEALQCNLTKKNNRIKKMLKTEKCFFIKSMTLSNVTEWVEVGGEVDPDDNPPSDPMSLLGSEPSEMEYDDFHSLYIYEYYVHIINVSLIIQKEDIQHFFFDLVEDFQITFVYDKNGSRTQECFVMFITENDFQRALGLDKAILKGQCVRVLPISKTLMLEFIESKRNEIPEDPAPEEQALQKCQPPEMKFMYMRNFSANVSKGDILNFLTGFSVTKENVILLYNNNNGNALGEALVKFSSQGEAFIAEAVLNYKIFQGTEILLQCISEDKLEVFGIDRF